MELAQGRRNRNLKGGKTWKRDDLSSIKLIFHCYVRI